MNAPRLSKRERYEQQRKFGNVHDPRGFPDVCTAKKSSVDEYASAPKLNKEQETYILSLTKESRYFDGLRNRVRLRALMIRLKWDTLNKTLPFVSIYQVKGLLARNNIDFTGSKKYPYKYKGIWHYPKEEPKK